jgi:hypothetical protein
MIADATGVNRVFLQLHSRGAGTVPTASVHALLLVAPFAGGVVGNLPADFAARTQARDATAGWLAGTAWLFADPATPYRSPVVALTAREPQIVEWAVDFAALGFAPAAEVILLALVGSSVAGEALASAVVDVQRLIEGPLAPATAGVTKAAARRVRLDAVAVIPPP